ncbi:MAG: hypothetical protein A3F70_04920 [Acidobacteria bacterium RIFCSPLOWO2_12_FULL_67_14]|nr:MAG: hypothetical protein A3H29_02660 [Acidobacteria bacterium RIFCSPLOWO2_02_FULL_67_21]OFW37796.1 MAG: hypothetical protein A3F70_04920 [Acidobacteria bacterium RIFCSPLOWO2_12_FULL_67_14]
MRRYVFYTIFDDVSGTVSDGTVTLRGRVGWRVHRVHVGLRGGAAAGEEHSVFFGSLGGQRHVCPNRLKHRSPVGLQDGEAVCLQ